MIRTVFYLLDSVTESWQRTLREAPSGCNWQNMTRCRTTSISRDGCAWLWEIWSGMSSKNSNTARGLPFLRSTSPQLQPTRPASIVAAPCDWRRWNGQTLHFFYEVGLTLKEFAARLCYIPESCRMRLYRTKKHWYDLLGKRIQPSLKKCYIWQT